MTIKLEITAANPQEFASELIGAFAVLAQRTQAAPQARPAPVDVTPPAPTQDAAPPKKTRKSPAAKTGGDMPDEKPEEIAALETVTQAQVKEKLIALLEAKGDEAPPKLLAEFGVEKLSKLATGDYAKAIARVDELIAEKDK